MKKIKILLVEDDLTLQNVLQNTMEEFGCEITCANNGLEALVFLENKIYDVIISDIKMPKMDGMSLLETLRELKIPTPVIMMTGYSEFKDDQVAGRGGVVLLEKPFTKEKLKELFDEYISLLPTGTE